MILCKMYLEDTLYYILGSEWIGSGLVRLLRIGPGRVKLGYICFQNGSGWGRVGTGVVHSYSISIYFLEREGVAISSTQTRYQHTYFHELFGSF